MKEGKKRALGRGLEALLPDLPKDRVEEGMPALIHIDLIDPNPFQPRVDWPDESLKSLADSIRAQGILQPVVLRPSGDRYQIISGERRFRAGKMAGLQEIPAVFREADDRQMLALALVENIQRSDLNPMEKAEAFQRFCSEFRMTQEELGMQVGLDRTTVSNFQRLLDLPEKVRDLLRSGRLSMGHGRALLGLGDESRILHGATIAVKREMSVRALENWVRERRPSRSGAGKRKPPSPEVTRLEADLQRTLGTRVRIRDTGGRGVIEIGYASLDDLDRLLGLFRGKSR